MQFSRLLGLVAIGCVTGCATFGNHEIVTCAKFATGDWAPWDSTMVTSLPGRYDLILISEDPGTYNKAADATLELHAAGDAKPGKIIQPDGNIALAASDQPLARLSKSAANLHVARVGSTGFSGTWWRDDNPSDSTAHASFGGRFCALRR